VAAAFDDLLGFAQIASGTAGYTGTLTVRMRQPTPLYEMIDYDAGVDRVEGRKIWVSGRSWCGDELLADCEILFIQPRTGGPAINQIYDPTGAAGTPDPTGATGATGA
jgi:hypothetical protein